MPFTTPLPDSKTDMITLPNLETKNDKNKQKARLGDETTTINIQVSKETQHIILPEIDPYALNAGQDKLETSEYNEINSQQSSKYNIYNREILYKEVWERPVTEVAKKYRVSDVAIHKVCKSLDVPTPPSGYWAKVYAGKPVNKIPLPKTDKPVQKFGSRTNSEDIGDTDNTVLSFMEGEEREMLFAIADQIQLTNKGAKMHPKIIAHRRTITEWNKNNIKIAGRYLADTWDHGITANPLLFFLM
ncbi:hypothetical protein [Lacrimispora amygdalina]|uniref:hypothetical protein n=1 Tax=Lacrimispora amygdalina TaxID=253257 RepID=UPI000BE3F848|nr:hypothetical protein [Lacrimispora amygdalina]